MPKQQTIEIICSVFHQNLIAWNTNELLYVSRNFIYLFTICSNNIQLLPSYFTTILPLVLFVVEMKSLTIKKGTKKKEINNRSIEHVSIQTVAKAFQTISQKDVFKLHAVWLDQIFLKVYVFVYYISVFIYIYA